MPIIPRLDRIMADRKVSVNELAQRIDLAPNNISRIRTGKLRAIRIDTMEALCRELRCQPSDLFEYVPEEANL